MGEGCKGVSYRWRLSADGSGGRCSLCPAGHNTVGVQVWRRVVSTLLSSLSFLSFFSLMLLFGSAWLVGQSTEHLVLANSGIYLFIYLFLQFLIV